MKEIPLTQGYVALVDDEDFERVSAYPWCVLRRRKTVYAQRKLKPVGGKQVGQLMHRFLLGLTDPKIQGDHINGNGLDNRRSNLRACTQSQNLANRGPNANNTSGFKGVYWQKNRRKWLAQIMVNREFKYLGYFSTKEAAAEAYARAAKQHCGEFSI